MSHELRIDEPGREFRIESFTGEVPRIGDLVSTFDDEGKPKEWIVSRIRWWIEPPRRDSASGVSQLKASRAVVYVKSAPVV